MGKQRRGGVGSGGQKKRRERAAAKTCCGREKTGAPVGAPPRLSMPRPYRKSGLVEEDDVGTGEPMDIVSEATVPAGAEGAERNQVPTLTLPVPGRGQLSLR